MLSKEFELWFQKRFPAIPLAGASQVISLSEGGATIPFIARYRKEATGNLDEVAIIQVVEAKQLWDDLEKRKAFVLKEIASQEKLTDDLKAKILAADSLGVLEDLYLPFKKKRKTKATIAREAGLQPLADLLWQIGNEGHSTAETLEQLAEKYLNPEAKITSGTLALDGAGSIITERLAEDASLRQIARETMYNKGHIVTRKGAKAKSPSKFELYFEHDEPVASLMDPRNSHRYLAMRRGWNEEELTMNLAGAGGEDTVEQELLDVFAHAACSDRASIAAPVLLKSARLACKVYVWSSIENELHASLKQAADDTAIDVFANNVRTVLLDSPLGSKTVLGVDPGQRTGCKLALVDRSGAFVADTVIKLMTPAEQAQAKQIVERLVTRVELEAVAVGNGTAGRETEIFFRKTLKELGKAQIPVIMISESGASIYSASEIARREFPNLDLTVRGAISIARRLQDPLSELVKVDPKSIGVGQYQHDVSQPALKKSLQRVVESCVNSVGVDVNTASEYLLSFVSGIGPSLAKNVVAHRQEKGLFTSRKQLLDVAKFGAKAFQQAAGFLRIANAAHPLDQTGIHPERYSDLEAAAERLGVALSALLADGASMLNRDSSIKEALGEFTFADVVQELAKPGRDPRKAFEAFEFLEGIFEPKDLTEGMICPGIVTNVTNFGVFIDIGVHQDGFAHISKLSSDFVKDPRDVVSPGMKVRAKVMSIDLAKNQIGLSLRLSDEPGKEDRSRGRKVESSSSSGRRSSHGGGSSRRRDGGRGDRRGRDGGRGRGEDKTLTNTPFAGLGSLVTK